jgi:hypothetical protein
MWESAADVQEEPKVFPHFNFLSLAQSLDKTVNEASHVSKL